MIATMRVGPVSRQVMPQKKTPPSWQAFLVDNQLPQSLYVSRSRSRIATRALAKHTHRRPMLSLANAFSDEELAAWEERNARLVPEVKRAGLHRRDQDRWRCGESDLRERPPGLRRHPGQWTIGEDDEVSMPYAGLKRVNADREKQGEPPFANPSKATADGLRSTWIPPRNGVECAAL
jgi:hypothetical protein